MNKPDDSPSKDPEDSNAKNKQKGRGKKRKRPSSDSSSDEELSLPDNTLEIEKSLHASAIKNNLDDASVKKILKKVVTNDHVLALVKLREEEEDSGTEESQYPKLTRAKAKELMKASPKSAPWNLELTPIKHIPVKTRPEVKALIAQELPDDEDDDEYEPTHDDVPSDDDHMLESSSDIDSLPRTPATPHSQRKSSTPNVVNDGPFKVPQQDLSIAARRKLVLEEEEATIALRTRSKLSLSATSIEHIESSFVPPDDLPKADVDSLWNNFLNDCLNPASNARNEDDDETDPEYSVAADPDAAEEEDEESLENSIIKISKKELNDLMTELFSIVPDGATEQLAENMMQEVLTEHRNSEQPPCWEGKQEPVSDDENNTEIRKPSITVPAPVILKRDSTTTLSIGKSEPQDDRDAGNTEANVSSNCASLKENEPIDSKENIDTVPLDRRKDNENISTQQTQESASHPKERRIASKESNGVVYPPVLSFVIEGMQETVRVDIPREEVVLPEQRALLAQQLRQHIQLAASSFLQLYVHPEHWAKAPQYKDFVMTFHNIGIKNPSSVVNVCNLKPAVDLIISWEESVSEDSPENVKMVEFLIKEVERCRRRSAQNAVHVGNFPEMLMKVVANSNVFLYPYLLPAMPFRPDNVARRFSYMRSEDALIALGLEQFWEYVASNPALYKPPSNVHPRHRWGLTATTRLISKYMLPCMTPKMIGAHINLCKKIGDENNPICKFFKTNTVEPMKHTLLPYNPQLTLYEQPEIEMPQLWLRYIVKSRKHSVHKYKRKDDFCGKAPEGIELNLAMRTGPPKKLPLSKDFTKTIPSNRLNILPPKIVEQTAPNITIIRPNVYTVVKTSTGSFLVPVNAVTVDSNTAPICTPVINISLNNQGASENTSVEKENAKSAEESKTQTVVDKTSDVDKTTGEHCQCCVMIRKTRRVKQKNITDYFKPLKGRKKCDCRRKRYPRITNRLRLLINNFKSNSECVQSDLKMKITTLEKQYREGYVRKESTDGLVIDDSIENDFATAMSFMLKLSVKSSVIRDNLSKRRIHTLFSRFDVHHDSVVELAKALDTICNAELLSVYKEFAGFLTAEQADALGVFKDYFVQRYENKLIEKIENLVLDKRKRIELLRYLHKSFHTNFFLKWPSCEICAALLNRMKEYPDLMEYVFSLFPHQGVHSHKERNPITITKVKSQEDKSSQTVIRSKDTKRSNNPKFVAVNGDTRKSTENIAMDCDVDHSSSQQKPESSAVSEDIRKSTENIAVDCEPDHSSSKIPEAGTTGGDVMEKTEDLVIDHEAGHSSSGEDNEKLKKEEAEIIPKDLDIKEEIDVLDISIRRASSDSETSMLVISDEDPLKTEPSEWTRDEDKTILEILKEHITPEERKDIKISEILKDTPIVQIIMDSLTHKTIDQIKDRILILLQLLVSPSEKHVTSRL